MTSATDASVVPIRITLDGRTGVTLWATPWEEDGEEWQAFLGAGQRVLVFGTAEEMAAHLRSGEDNDLTDHPRWRDLLQLTPAELEPDEDYIFDLDGAYELALADPDPYTVSELSDLVDLVQRVAEVCDDGVLLRLVEDTPEFAALLSDDATFTGAEGEQRWTDVGSVVEQSWERLIDRFNRLIEWRGSEVAADADDADAEDDDIEPLDAEDEPARQPAAVPAGTAVVGSTGPVVVSDDDADDPTDGGTYSIWEVAGILPLAVTLPSGTGYTLRTYNGDDDEPIFLGADLTVDLFRTAEGLAAYCRSGAEHDLSEMVTWQDVTDAEELPVTPEPSEVYDLRAPDEDSIELALELADYCDLETVTGTLTRRRTGEIPFDDWKAAVEELETCIRWQD